MPKLLKKSARTITKTTKKEVLLNMMRQELLSNLISDEKDSEIRNILKEVKRLEVEIPTEILEGVTKKNGRRTLKEVRKQLLWHKMTDKQRDFCEHFKDTKNGELSAMKAGYNGNYVNNPHKLLQIPVINEYIKLFDLSSIELSIADDKEIQQMLTEIARDRSISPNARIIAMKNIADMNKSERQLMLKENKKEKADSEEYDDLSEEEIRYKLEQIKEVK